eukprot:scaffold122232_cov63-Phaeocystis_antarctica.AAC.1
MLEKTLLELVAHVLASAAGGDLGEIGDTGGAELPRSRFVVFVAGEDHGCGTAAVASYHRWT